MRGAVFAYHAQNCGGYDYASNDHLAFERDLAAIVSAQLPVVSLETIASALADGEPGRLPERFVGLSCDDGTSLDWADYDHPEFGEQTALANLLRAQVNAGAITGKQLLTAFVIGCPSARREIDRGCYGGLPLSDDGWWAEAAREGLLAIGNHSLDHVHETLPDDFPAAGQRGDFTSVDTYALADRQVRQAADTIDSRLQAAGQRTRVFAYPYGHVSPYLRDSYFPQFRQEHRMLGAFTTEQAYIEQGTHPYAIPRFVCGDAWRSPAQFDTILQQLGGSN
jgi:hypothetical protein